MIYKYIAVLIVSVLLSFLLRDVVSNFSYGSYKDVLSTLLNVSSIIFAIIGAWIAIIYPKSMSRAFKGGEYKSSLHENAEEDASYLSDLIEIALVSAFVLMALLLAQYLFPILKVLLKNKDVYFYKVSAFTLVTFLTLSQLYAIFSVILANYFFLGKLRKKNVDDKINQLAE